MNKTECIAYASRCRHAAAEATDRAATFAATFGGDDELTKRALARVERDNHAAREWDKLAAMHPQTRAKLFRDKSLPVEIFGYSEEPAAPAEAPAAQAAPAPTVADTLLEMAHATMLEQFKESQWFNTAPAAARAVEPVITITGIEQRQVFISMGVIGHGAVLRPFLVGHVELGGISAKLCMRFDYGAGGLVVLEGE